MKWEDFEKKLVRELIYANVIIWGIIALVVLVGWIMGAY